MKELQPDDIMQKGDLLFLTGCNVQFTIEGWAGHPVKDLKPYPDGTRPRVVRLNELEKRTRRLMLPKVGN